MSKQKLAYTIQKELFVLNDRIDRKIIRNKPYSKEAGRHKTLLRQLHALNRKEQGRRILGFFSMLKSRTA